MLSKQLLRSRGALQQQCIRSFGGGSHGPQPVAPNGLKPLLDHSGAHDDHHHAHAHVAGPDQTFIASDCNTKTLVFDGMKGKTNAVISLDN